jgi:L-aminopeptidase/D-esterase-like protein
VVTNHRLDPRSLRQLAVQVHASLARSIQPFHALVDGDVLCAVTTNEVENEDLTATSLGVVVSELAWDAVLASVPEGPA